MQPLPREEYIEQAYLYRALSQRMNTSDPVQEILAHVREEILATTKLPMAIDFLLAELTHVGTMSTAMGKMGHYFTPFQTYLIAEAESDRGRFDMNIALTILEHEARFRAESGDPISLFLFQFETLSRHRLSFDIGLGAMCNDPVYDDNWNLWIKSVRHKIGIVDLADLVYIQSEHYVTRQQQMGKLEFEKPDPILFGEKEGRIALANRSKEPLYLFLALQRQLNYPKVPKIQRKNRSDDVVPKLLQTVSRLESRVKLLEDEQRGKGIDLSQFYGPDENQDLE